MQRSNVLHVQEDALYPKVYTCIVYPIVLRLS